MWLYSFIIPFFFFVSRPVVVTADGLLNVTAQPLWINYGENATITFSFSPPCPSMSIFRKTSPNSCYVGSTCLNNPQSGLVTLDPMSAFIRFVGQSYKVNDHYWGVCSDTLTMYRSSNSTTLANNLNIGVNPRVLTIEIDPPDFPPQPLSRVTGFSGDTFIFNGTIDLRSGDSQIAIGIGRGFNPSPPPYGSDFTFNIPEFSDTVNGTYSFVEQDSQGPSNFAIGEFPAGYRYRYHFSRENLVQKGICTIKATAIATLANTQIDQVSFQVNFAFDPIISDITVVVVNDTLTYPFAKPGDCLFSCSASACPVTDGFKYEWSFYATFMPSYNSEMTGNVPGYPHLYLVNASDCRELYAKVVRNRLENEYKVSCRVSTPNGANNDKFSRFYDLLNPFLRTTTAATTTRQYRPGGYPPVYEANVNNDRLEDWKIAVIVIGCVVFVGLLIAFIVIIVKVRGRGAATKKAPTKQHPGRMGLPPGNSVNNTNARPVSLTNIGGLNQAQQQQQNQGLGSATGFAPYQPKLAPNGGSYGAANGGPQPQTGRSPGPIDKVQAPAPLYMSTGNGPYDQQQNEPAKMNGSGNSMGQLGYVNLGSQGGGNAGLYDNPNHITPSIYTEIAVNNTPRSRAPIQTTYAQLEQPPMLSLGGSNSHLLQQPQQIPPLQMAPPTQYSHALFDRTMP